MTASTADFQEPKLDSALARGIILFAVIVPFLATIYAVWSLWTVAVWWPDIIIFAVMYIFTGLGITVGYHRMLTHNGFQSRPIVRFIFLAMGSMAVEGGALTWSVTHLKHHAHSDQDGDPHSPLEGFFHSHMGWIIDGWKVEPEKHGPWLLQDKMVMWFERTFVFWILLSLAIPFVAGGLIAMWMGLPFMGGAWTGILWGGGVRIFITHHVTWSVNSICHTFGGRMFETKDMSRNNLIVGLLAFGEGWHNNHHAFPNSAFHGMRWWQIDTSAYLIRILEKLGIVWEVKRVSPEQFERRLASTKAKRAAMAASKQTVAETVTDS